MAVPMGEITRALVGVRRRLCVKWGFVDMDVYEQELLMSEKLYPHLLEIDWTAQERVDTMLPHMMEAAGVTEELKACDPMRWVGLMNTLTAQIEEILIRELICS